MVARQDKKLSICSVYSRKIFFSLPLCLHKYQTVIVSYRPVCTVRQTSRTVRSLFVRSSILKMTSADRHFSWNHEPYCLSPRFQSKFLHAEGPCLIFCSLSGVYQKSIHSVIFRPKNVLFYCLLFFSCTTMFFFFR